jgi:hypothetical protein
MSLTKRTQAPLGWAKDWLGAAAAAVAVVEAVEAAEVAADAVAVAVAAVAAGHGVFAASASLAFCDRVERFRPRWLNALRPILLGRHASIFAQRNRAEILGTQVT